MDDFITPVLPKGRGLWRREVNGGNVGRPTMMSECFNNGGGVSGDNIQTSTPRVDVNAFHQFTDMVGQLGTQIGESIVAKLMSAGVVHLSSDTQTQTPTHSPTCDGTKCDSPHVTVHVTPDRDLQTFKGDSSDKVSVQDWIDMTRTYLRKKGTPLREQAEEIMGHLMGKARDVVKIALRGDPDLNVSDTPTIIYDILLRYFSEAPSCLPLADFYATLPRNKENPVDYWIRLNKAADRAEEGLRRQGNAPSSLNNEVALMFVKHCPDPELSATFKWKPIHEWSSKDVQLRIDDYQRELRANERAFGAAQLKVHTAEVAPGQPNLPPVNVHVPEQCHPISHLPPATLHAQTVRSPTSLASSPTPQVMSQVDPSTATFAPVPVMAQNLQQSEERLLNRMAEMFREVLDNVQMRSARPAMYSGPARTRQHRPKESSCRVCGVAGHSTISHCMSERLCFECLAPGHTRPKCPRVASESALPQNQGN